MKIQTLIARLTEIAVYRPDAIVHVEDGMDPSDISPITAIECNKGTFNGTAEIYLSSGYFEEQPFNIEEFK